MQKGDGKICLSYADKDPIQRATSSSGIVLERMQTWGTTGTGCSGGLDGTQKTANLNRWLGSTCNSGTKADPPPSEPKSKVAKLPLTCLDLRVNRGQIHPRIRVKID